MGFFLVNSGQGPQRTTSSHFPEPPPCSPFPARSVIHRLSPSHSDCLEQQKKKKRVSTQNADCSFKNSAIARDRNRQGKGGKRKKNRGAAPPASTPPPKKGSGGRGLEAPLPVLPTILQSSRALWVLQAPSEVLPRRSAASLPCSGVLLIWKMEPEDLGRFLRPFGAELIHTPRRPAEAAAPLGPAGRAPGAPLRGLLPTPHANRVRAQPAEGSRLPAGSCPAALLLLLTDAQAAAGAGAAESRRLAEEPRQRAPCLAASLRRGLYSGRAGAARAAAGQLLLPFSSGSGSSGGGSSSIASPAGAADSSRPPPASAAPRRCVPGPAKSNEAAAAAGGRGALPFRRAGRRRGGLFSSPGEPLLRVLRADRQRPPACPPPARPPPQNTRGAAAAEACVRLCLSLAGLGHAQARAPSSPPRNLIARL